MAVKHENQLHQEMENLTWQAGDTPTERGKYQITIEDTDTLNSNIELIVKIDSFDLKVWRNFKKYAAEHYKIVAFRTYDPQPFKSEAYVNDQVKKVENQIEALKHKLTQFKGD